MADFIRDVADDGVENPTEVKIEQIAEEVLEDIRLGLIDDVASALEKRLAAAGVELRPEAIDNLAEDIENEASR
jgi:hypothetical protein